MWLALPNYNLSLREFRSGTQSSRTRRDHEKNAAHWLILSLMLSFLCYTTQLSLFRNGTAHSGLGHPTIISEESHTDTAIGQSDLGNPSIETPSDDSKLCQGHS